MEIGFDIGAKFNLGDTVVGEFDNGLKIKSFVYQIRLCASFTKPDLIEITLLYPERPINCYTWTRYIKQERCKLTRMVLFEKIHDIWSNHLI